MAMSDGNRARGLLNRVEFVVTSAHLALIRSMRVDWNDTEAGAPEINCKRPYGNGDVGADVARILGWEKACEDCGYTEAQKAAAMVVHEEVGLALQIVLTTGTFLLGHYVRTMHKRNWRLVVDK